MRELLVVELLVFFLHFSPGPHPAPWDFAVILTRDRVAALCVFKYSVLIDMIRPRDQKTISIERIIYYSKFPKGGEHAKPRSGTQISTRVSQEAKEGGNVGRRFYCGFHGKKQVRQGTQAWSGLYDVRLPLVV